MAMKETLAAAERQVTEWLARVRVLPVLTVTDLEKVTDTCRALVDGGVTCLEITFRTALAADAIALASQQPGLIVAAGTVLNAGQVMMAARAGAQFALAPGLSEPVVAAAHEAGLPFFPGVATPTEIDRARTLGLSVVKVFPASSLGGPAFLRAISAPYPDMRFIPTGGINDATFGQYLAVPSVLACGASWLCPPDLVAEGQFDEMRRRAEATIAGAR